MDGTERRARLAAVGLYLVCDARPGGRPLADVLRPALAGGVDIFQLRDKHLDDEALLDAAGVARRLCADAGALFVLNDRPGLAALAEADGVHVGQDDMPVAQARALVGPDRFVGQSTHSPAQIAASDADYIGVGPVHPTPTKRWRPSVGLELVAHAAAHARQPFFAIGGIDATNAAAVLAAGARGLAVVRAVGDAPDPEAAAYRLRSMVRDARQARGRA